MVGVKVKNCKIVFLWGAVLIHKCSDTSAVWCIA